jgi:Fe-S cluster assembly scaffold protein SufB
MINFYNLIIYCDEGSEINCNVLKNSSVLDLGSVLIYQEKNSHVKLRILNENFHNSSGVDYIKSFQDKNSTAEIGIFSTLIQQNKKIFIENNLMDYAQVKYNGLFNGKYSHVDHDFHILHSGSYSKSNILFKMAVLDETYGIFWGDTRIIPGTAGCEGYQQNKNMTLGKNARVDAIPRLEIETENVIASHGSATGEISDDEIFYMMSRGLSQDDARKLLLRGFFEDVLRQSFGHDPDVSDIFLEKIWSNIQKILGMDINQ